MSDTVDLRSTLTELCKKAGLDKKNVAWIHIEEDSATFGVYDLDGADSRYISPQTNEWAMAEVVSVPIQF